MKIITIDKATFLKGFSIGKNVDDGGFSPQSIGFEVDRAGSNYYGMLNPGRTLVDYSTNIADNIVASYPHYRSSKHYYYAIGSNGKIYETDISAHTHTVKATESTKTYNEVSDIIVYAGGLFITSTTDIYYDDFTFGVNDYDWLTGTKSGVALTPTVPHKLFKFQGNLYITNGNKILEWDGTDLTEDKLKLEAGWIITDVEIDGRLIYITASYGTNNYAYKTETRIFAWNSVSGNWEKEIRVDAPHIGAIVKVDVGFVFFAGVSLYYFDGYNYSWRKYVGVAPTFNRAKVHNGIVYFITTSGIAAYNWRLNCLSHPIYSAVTMNNFNIGMLDYIDIFAETSKFYRAINNTGTATWYSNWYDLGSPSVIKKMEIIFAENLVAGCSYQVNLYNEKDSEYVQETITYATDGGIRKKVIPINLNADLFNISILMNNAANKAIKSIKVYYEPTERSITN